MRDDDDRAREVKDGFLQDVLRADVEVVRRLVEDKEVCGAKEELDKGYTTTLTPTEDGDLLLRLLTAEHKGPEEVIDAQADIPLRFAVNSLVDGVVPVQLLALRLGEVADLDVVPELERARVVADFSHDTLDEGGLPRAILPDESDLLSALDGHIHIREDGVLAVALREAIDDHGVSTRRHRGEEGEVHRRAVNVLHLDTVNLRELLDAALHLYSLSRLVAEALDEVFGRLDLLLLILVGAALLLEALLT